MTKGVGKRSRGYAAIGLYQHKTPANLGGVLRAAGCYGAAMVAYTGNRYPGSIIDTVKAHHIIPLLHPEDLRDVIPYDCVPVAVDLLEGARCLTGYTHPRNAFYIFGPEDSTLGTNVTDWCRDIISVPTRFCMNLAATVNVVLYDRLAKEMRT
jgi:tRNA(Leu) C34 or U34 (ribose-2'-O)-methylase TrmL